MLSWRENLLIPPYKLQPAMLPVLTRGQSLGEWGEDSHCPANAVCSVFSRLLHHGWDLHLRQQAQETSSQGLAGLEQLLGYIGALQTPSMSLVLERLYKRHQLELIISGLDPGSTQCFRLGTLCFQTAGV